jgi:hypothetical protein
VLPFFVRFSEEFEMDFVLVDSTEIPQLCKQYDVSKFPTFIVLQKQVVIDRLVGSDPTALRTFIQQFEDCPQTRHDPY